MKEDSLKMRAKDRTKLLRAWRRNYHRILTAEAHMKPFKFREESRYTRASTIAWTRTLSMRRTGSAS